jgi:hypothetical protein
VLGDLGFELGDPLVEEAAGVAGACEPFSEPVVVLGELAGLRPEGVVLGRRDVPAGQDQDRLCPPSTG